MTMTVNEEKGSGKRRTNWTSIVFENMKIKDMRTAELKANDKENWKKWKMEPKIATVMARRKKKKN